MNTFFNYLVALVVLAAFCYLGWDKLSDLVQNSTEQTLAFAGFGTLVAGIVVVGSVTLSPRRM